MTVTQLAGMLASLAASVEALTARVGTWESAMPASVPPTALAGKSAQGKTRKARKGKAPKADTPAWLVARGKAGEQRKALYAARVAAGLPTTGPEWVKAKLAAGIVDKDTKALRA